MVKEGRSMLVVRLLMLLSLATVSLSNNGDFHLFYFVQQWLGSYCDQNGERCCYPATGRPAADFTVYGLWPYYNDGSFPYNCGSGNFNEALLKPMEDRLQREWPSFTCPLIGRKFWVHEWNKHGTCSKSVLGEINYFQAALDIKKKINLLNALANAGIRPDDRSYPLDSVKQAIVAGTGFKPWVDCNHNAQGQSQIWQISMCVDKSGTRVVNCPFIPKGNDGCASNVKFPYY